MEMPSPMENLGLGSHGEADMPKHNDVSRRPASEPDRNGRQSALLALQSYRLILGYLLLDGKRFKDSKKTSLFSIFSLANQLDTGRLGPNRSG
jgi:hypothetical protein